MRGGEEQGLGGGVLAVADADEARQRQLRTDFPAFDIAREITGDRIRYVSRRRHAGVQPHTVVTADLDELRAALTAQPGGPSPS